MCHAYLGTSNFWSLLSRIDEDLAERTRAEGCAVCRGKLHSARYPRKPRGAARAVLGEDYERRLSFCCARDGCRRRSTPPSVRFLGRRVFVATVVVLATALSAGLTGRRIARLGERFGVSVRTLRRWRQWWREAFAATSVWKSLRARLTPTNTSLLSWPAALLERCSGQTEEQRLIESLRLLAPLAASRCLREVA
jgi:hypothetical protein